MGFASYGQTILRSNRALRTSNSKRHQFQKKFSKITSIKNQMDVDQVISEKTPKNRSINSNRPNNNYQHLTPMIILAVVALVTWVLISVLLN